MSDICSKHGPYSVLCKMCDFETPTPPQGDARVTVPREEIIAAWLRELSSEANYADKGDGWKLTLKGKIERDKSRRRLSILRSLLSRLPSEEATEEDIETALFDYEKGGLPYIEIDALSHRLSKAGLRITRTPGGQT